MSSRAVEGSVDRANKLSLFFNRFNTAAPVQTPSVPMGVGPQQTPNELLTPPPPPSSSEGLTLALHTFTHPPTPHFTPQPAEPPSPPFPLKACVVENVLPGSHPKDSPSQEPERQPVALTSHIIKTPECLILD